jgi:hypothetical protein
MLALGALVCTSLADASIGILMRRFGNGSPEDIRTQNQPYALKIWMGQFSRNGKVSRNARMPMIKRGVPS